MLSVAGWLSDLWLEKEGTNVILAATQFDFSDILYQYDAQN